MYIKSPQGSDLKISFVEEPKKIIEKAVEPESPCINGRKCDSVESTPPMKVDY